MPKTKIPKEIIIKAAFEIAKEHGIDAVTAKSISKKLECSIQPVYWVFENMDNVRNAVLEEAKKKYTDFMSFTDIPGATPLQCVGVNFVKFAREYPHLFKFIFASDRQENVAIANSSLDDNKPMIIDGLKKEFDLDDKQAEDYYIKLGILCHGMAAMIMGKVARYDDADILRIVIEVSEDLLKRYKSK